MSNITNFNSTNVPICEICQISYGFTSADKRSIIVLVVLGSLALISCYIGVFWFACKTRYRPERIIETVYANDAFGNDTQDENPGKSDTSGTEKPVIIEMEKQQQH